MVNWLLDANVCIEILRGKVRGRRLPVLEECGISTIVAAELWTGASKSKDPPGKRQQLAEFLAGFEPVLFDAAAAEHYGDIRAQLERAGTPIGPLDQLIAAQARSLGATLLTDNLREFQRVPGLKCHPWA